MHIKQATIADTEVLFSWVNDLNIRSNAFNSTKITFKEHQCWLSRKLLSSKCIIFIGYEGKKPIGQVRFDKEKKNHFSVDIHIDPEKCGCGLGKKLLTLTMADCYGNGLFSPDTCIEATIFESNSASYKMFINSNFIHEKNEIVADIPCNVLVYKTKISPFDTND